MAGNIKLCPTAKFAVLEIGAAGSKSKSKSKSKKGGDEPELLPVPPFDVSQLRASTESLEERFRLCRSVAEECIQEEELRKLLEARPHPIVYDGFEPSGRMHIAQGVLRVINVNRLTKAGCHFKFWVADWFAQLNNKMGGDLKKIQTVGKYMIEIWKAVGMDMTNVQFLWASEEINKAPDEYWSRVMEIARLNSLARIKKCGTIMGRQEDADSIPSSQIFYPCMQCADVFFLKADICQLGMDQRKVNMLAREYCDQIKRKFKPVILGHHMLAGLAEGQEKMSKSQPDSAIFMEDSAEDVSRKIKKAFCPPGVAEGNPILDYVKHLLFGYYGQLSVTFKADSSTEVYSSYEALEADFVSGKLHPSDLKPACAEALNRILQPVRAHFATGDAKVLLDKVKKFKVTK